MYGKIFDSMYDGTISANWQGLVTFQQMIVLCDADGVIDMTPPALSRRTGIPLEIIEKGIEFLESIEAITRKYNHSPYGWFLEKAKDYKWFTKKTRYIPNWDEIRQFVFKRDGFTCQYCGDTDSDLECDHIIPFVSGGSDELDNLTTSCVSCNRSKGSKSLYDWLQWRAQQ